MAINGISDTTGMYQTYQSNGSSSIRQDFQTLNNSLSSGNVSAAQSAIESISQQLSSNTKGGSSSLTSDLQSIQSSLQSGDLTSAQKTYSTMQQNMQSVKGHHHHHGGGGGKKKTSDTTDSSSDTSQNPFQILLQTVSNLQNAISTGNLSGAQTSVGQLLTDNSNSSLLTGSGQSNQGVQSILSSLNSGDVSSAQSLVDSFIQNLQNSFSGNAIGNIIDVKS